MKRIAILSVVLCLLFTLTIFACCDDGIKEIKDWESNPVSTDNNPYYKDYYHIFTYSFADGNGDGIGDLKGIESKLDYIADLGFTGIWLSPINPSPTNRSKRDSYHKYEIIDYCNVDPEFGTLDDFKSLVSKAHEKGISVMLDMVFNHTSNQHPWFKASQNAFKNDNKNNAYYDFYTFTAKDGSLYNTYGGYTHMPKLNLKSQGVRNEIDKICKFWLQDYGVDAFRLDAAYHFFGNAAGNVEFMTWLMSTAKKYNENVYMVGEVWKNDATVYSHYAENSVQSFFDFQVSGTNGYNSLIPVLNTGAMNKSEQMKKVVTAKENGTAKGIDALFASNHDTSRVSNLPLSYYSFRDEAVRSDLMEKHKMGIALLYTQTGNVFNYYGNEIGLRNGLRDEGGEDYIDQTYRIAMNWGNGNTVSHDNGFAYGAYGASTGFGAYDDYLGGVSEQINDQNSLYNFYRRIMLLRRQNIEIARGTSTFVEYEDTDVAIIVREYNGSKILLVYNLNDEEIKTVDVAKIISDNGLEGKLAGFLSSDNHRDVTFKGTTVTMPQFSIAVIR